MSDLQWFSSKIRLACLIENVGATRYQDSIFVFLAKNWEDALKVALELGRKQEEAYFNKDDERVHWKLKEVISLDLITASSLDGVEVYSEPVDLEENNNISIDTEFSPERSDPTQTI